MASEVPGIDRLVELLHRSLPRFQVPVVEDQTRAHQVRLRDEVIEVVTPDGVDPVLEAFSSDAFAGQFVTSGRSAELMEREGSRRDTIQDKSARATYVRR